MKTKQIKNQMVIYQAANGAIELRYSSENKTFFAGMNQIADLFGVQKAAISKHLKNIFASNELSFKATVSKMETVQIEGERTIRRFIDVYNLDAIIAVGYRVNSKQATRFRIWSTGTLAEYVTKGFAVDRRYIQKNYGAFMEAVENIRHLLPEGSPIDHASVLELVSTFADTWLSLSAYDKDEMVTRGATKKSVALTAEQLQGAFLSFKNSLVEKGEATEIFGQERSTGSVTGIVGNVMQSFGGKSVYASIEEKAAHLLYFIVKNHPFVDGNKRSGAYAFVWFLNRAKILDRSKITPPALTALTLFIAESDPKNKDRLIKLVLQLLKK
ncbi:MAG: virulence protein RhuM/Fic/DOC family protein [bacterium]